MASSPTPLAKGDEIIVMGTYVGLGKRPGTALVQVGGLQVVVSITSIGQLGPVSEVINDVTSPGDGAPLTDPPG